MNEERRPPATPPPTPPPYLYCVWSRHPGRDTRSGPPLCSGSPRGPTSWTPQSPKPEGTQENEADPCNPAWLLAGRLENSETRMLRWDRTTGGKPPQRSHFPWLYSQPTDRKGAPSLAPYIQVWPSLVLQLSPGVYHPHRCTRMTNRGSPCICTIITRGPLIMNPFLLTAEDL